MMAKYYIFAAVAALARASTTPTTQCTDSCNPIALPGITSIVPVGTPFTITWTPTTTGTVTIILLNGPSTNILPIGSIADKIANSGSFSWTPATSLAPDVTHYGLQIINDADGTFQYSTQFGISNPSYASISSSSSATVSSSGSAALSTSMATSYATSNGTVAPLTTSTAIYVASTGMPAANSSIISPTLSMSVPSTLQSAAATTTKLGSPTGTSSTTSTTTKASSGATQLSMSFGGAMLALVGAYFAL